MDPVVLTQILVSLQDALEAVRETLDEHQAVLDLLVAEVFPGEAYSLNDPGAIRAKLEEMIRARTETRT